MLDLLAAGDLPEDEAAFYLRHIEVCPDCRAKYEAALQVVQGIQGALKEAIPQQSEVMDLWPSVRESVGRPKRRSVISWLTLEPVRTLVVAGVLTVGLYLIVGVPPSEFAGGMKPFPVYESNPVIVSTAKVDARPARVSGIESGDGKTVFLWLE